MDLFTTWTNNWEICDMDFFTQPQIKHFVDYIMETNGIYLYRWGDAILRYQVWPSLTRYHAHGPDPHPPSGRAQ